MADELRECRGVRGEDGIANIPVAW